MPKETSSRAINARGNKLKSNGESSRAMWKAQPHQCAYRQAAVRANYVEGAKLKSNVESSRAMWKAQYQQCAYRQGSSGQQTGTPGNTLDKNLSFCGINLYVNPLEALRRKTL